MLTRKQLTYEMEKLKNQNEALRRENLVYNKLQQLNEAHLAVVLARLGATGADPVVITREQIQAALEEMTVKVERKEDSVRLWYEVS